MDQLLPVVGIDRSSVARTLLLRLQLRLEGLQIDLDPLFAGDQLRQVDRETVGIVQQESVACREMRSPPLLRTSAITPSSRLMPVASVRRNELSSSSITFSISVCWASQFGELPAHLSDQPGHQTGR